MTGVALDRIVRYANRLLRVPDFRDWEGACNGLQVGRNPKPPVRRIAAAVDASLATARLAIEAGADLLIVHHGLFWGPTHPWTGKRHELLHALLDHSLAVYSVHLPLDAHPKLGNNAQLLGALGYARHAPFFEAKGQNIGRSVTTRIRREALVLRLEHALGRRPILAPGGPPVCRRIGVVTGAAGAEVAQAAEAGIDTFITGEGPHWSYAKAEELGVNLLYGGHYATETFGVKALARHLAARFRLDWTFLDYPTGL